MSRNSLEAVGAAWQDVYAAALLELDPYKLAARIKQAEQAIAARYSTFQIVPAMPMKLSDYWTRRTIFLC